MQIRRTLFQCAAASFLLTVELGGEGADPEQMKDEERHATQRWHGSTDGRVPCGILLLVHEQYIFRRQTGILRSLCEDTVQMPLLGNAGSAPGAAMGNGSTMSMAQMNPFAAAQNAGTAIQTKENPLWLHLQQNLQVQEEMMRAQRMRGQEKKESQKKIQNEAVSRARKMK